LKLLETFVKKINLKNKVMKKGVKFDYKQAYNKNLKPSARLHYLENARHDQDSPAKKIGPQGLGMKGNNGYTVGSPAKKSCSPMKKYGSPMKMGAHAIHKHMGGSPLNKTVADKRPGVSTLVYDYADKPAVDLSGPDTTISTKKPSSAKPTKSQLRKADRVEKTREKGAKALESGNKSKAMRLKRREQRLKKRIAKRSK